MDDKQKENIKNAFMIFIKAVIPPLTTFLGVVLLNLFGADNSALGAVVGASLGTSIFNAIA